MAHREAADHMRILVIEDSRFLRTLTQRALLKAGYDVVTEADGQQGVLRAQEIQPDLIVLDMMLPTMEGTTVLRALKNDSRTEAVPVVVVSGLSGRNEQKLKKLGAAAYFEKSSLELDKSADGLVQIIQSISVKLPA